jgi:hypothetical protein
LRQIDGQFAPAFASGIEDAELVTLQKDRGSCALHPCLQAA